MPKKTTKKENESLEIPKKTVTLLKEKATKKATKKPKEVDLYLILKDINPVKLIYEHLLNGVKLDFNDEDFDQKLQEEITKSNYDTDENVYIDHLIQDVEVTTNLTDILKETSTNYTLFTDIRKNNIKCWPLLTVEGDNAFNKKTFDYNKPTKIKCWWCKNSFNNLPLNIPILKKIIDGKEIIFGEGVVCSFSCGKSCIKELSKGDFSLRYKDSLSILQYLFDIFKKITNPEGISNFTKSQSDFGGSINDNIIPDAPHWTQLKDYGGHLTIDGFRSTFGKIKYNKTTNILLVSYPLLICETTKNK